MRQDVNEVWDSDGNLIYSEIVNVPHTPLSGLPLVGALNAALGVWSLEDAANLTGVTQQELIDEVLAWEEVQNGS